MTTVLFLYMSANQKTETKEVMIQLCLSTFVLYLEINDVIWCVWLKQIVFAEKEEVKRLYSEGILVKYELEAKESSDPDMKDFEAQQEL